MQNSDRDKYTGEPKYTDQMGNKYPDIESFQIGMCLQKNQNSGDPKEDKREYNISLEE